MLRLLSASLILVFTLTACSENNSTDTGGSEPVSLEPVVISVKGMHCEACVASIENVLRDMEGIASVDISLEKETAVLTPSGSTLPDAQEISDALERIGYEAEVPDFIQL